jgi:hypothetical protein
MKSRGHLALFVAICMLAACATSERRVSDDGGVTDDSGSGSDIDAPPGALVVGGACTSDADCGDGQCMTEADAGNPGGMCSKACDEDDASSCPTGSACIAGVCEDSCATETDCRAGYSCFDVGLAAGVCMPDCESNTDCGGTGVCNTYSGYCEPVGAKAKDGAACGADADCESGWCLAESSTGRPGGFCVSACEPGSGFCPDSGYCEDESTTPGGPAFAYCLDTCATSADCRAGYSCYEWTDTVGACWPNCTADAQCPDSGTCNEYSGFCETPSGAADGAACSTNADCASGLCDNETDSGNPDGTCRSYCDPTAANPCPDGGACLDYGDSAIPGAFGVCFDTCASVADCRPGYVCQDEGLASGLCEADCESDAECPDTSTCNKYTGYCEPTGAKGKDGAACTTGTDCESGWCWTEAGTGRPGGICTSVCNPGSGVCPDSGYCQDASTTQNGPTFAYCMDTCAAGADCRAGYSCLEWTGTTAVCYPDCTSNTQCPGTTTCNLYSGFCEPTTGGVDGAACTTDADCASGICDTQGDTGNPKGTCRSQCNPSVTNSCPSGGVCFDYGTAGNPGVYGLCWDGCTSSSQCRAGYSCFNVGGGVGACFADCTADSQCAGAVGCNEYSGYCEPLGTAGNDGAQCTTDADCKSGFCQSQATYGYPGGMCVSECDPKAASPFCPDSGLCVGSTASGPQYGICHDTCAASTDCRTGYGCWKQTSSGPGLCSADCTSNTQCGGSNCNVYSGYCEATTGAIDGAACTTDADCASNYCLTDGDGWTNGYCLGFCTPTRSTCPADGQDGVASACIAESTYGDFGYCYDGCTASSQCRQGDGYSCVAETGGSVCE